MVKVFSKIDYHKSFNGYVQLHSWVTVIFILATNNKPGHSADKTFRVARKLRFEEPCQIALIETTHFRLNGRIYQ